MNGLAPEEIASTWTTNATRPSRQVLATTPNGNHWGATNQPSGTWPRPTASCSAS
ncbi:hypothetical protein [Streptomyces jeddahensis]|uniref:Endo-1,4-beta-xylanase B n=1 Tax=Streptomyces jeddahensis TaxID=1716141 RepID=A0A177HRB6_9ACTN|nr:hypothetical protein [Streptomyces jeddahensis]OAH13443.1 endo-1,4-beta-xylanase B precursor [Streptomyces jeddahensis]